MGEMELEVPGIKSAFDKWNLVIGIDDWILVVWFRRNYGSIFDK